TAVDKAESEPETSMLVNATTPGVIAEAAAKLGAWFIHYSTDYVFSGTGNAPWREDDPTAPLNEYGHSKWVGEENVRASGCRHLIFRTSWVFASRGSNFARTMLKLAQERETLKVINDQVGAPTGADLLADITAHAIRAAQTEPGLSGTYHCAPAGETTWYGYACHVISRARAAGLPIKVADADIQAVPTSDF